MFKHKVKKNFLTLLREKRSSYLCILWVNYHHHHLISILLLYWNIYSSFFHSFIFVANTYLFTSVTMLVSVSLLYAFSVKMSINNAWKVSKFGVFSGPYFPLFGLNALYLSVFSPNSGKYGPEKTPYLDTFHAV